jgi:hypothetical protein
MREDPESRDPGILRPRESHAVIGLLLSAGLWRSGEWGPSANASR